jgi:hypothetical protein
MFSYYYNYFFFFFGYELLVMVCFFFFLFFAILSDKGQLELYLQGPSAEARVKFTRHLQVRERAIGDLVSHLDRSVLKMKKIPTLYETASIEALLRLQGIVKKLSNTYTALQIRYYLDSVTIAPQTLSLQIRLFLVEGLFGGENNRAPLKGPSGLTKLKITAI